ncbi:MAG: GEVED domain-containing protein, partial [Raineya sp.]
ADEAGSAPGPDYRFGWGLLNAEKAVNAITNRGTSAIIDERTLNNGTTYTRSVVAAGNAPLEVTIAWNDPAGTPLANGTLNSTSVRLVNDLDVRVTYNGTTTFPWRLDPAAPANAATKGDNFRDNVEKIIIDNPVAGATYTITVSHKGTLKGSNPQAYSLIVTGISSAPAACNIPSSLSTSSITASGATLNWGSVSGAVSYDVRVKPVSSSTWTNYNGRTGNSFALTGLAASTNYEWQIRTNCSGTSSAYSASVTFTTSASAPSCAVPSGLTASAITSSSVTLSWGAVTGASTYDVRIRVSGASTWTDFNGRTTNSLGLTGLTASTTYEWQVRTNCSASSSAYSASATFSTPAASVTYCASRGNNNQYEWIDLVRLGSINRTSARETNGYTNTGLSTNLARGSSQTITYSAGFSSSSYTEYWKVWIDWNQNGTFETSELVVNRTSSSSANLSNSFTVPTTALLGQTRMRVSMSDANQTACSNPFNYGEVEDYTINVTSGAARTMAFGEEDVESDNFEVKLYPNPANSGTKITLQLSREVENTTIQILDMSGKVVRKETISGATYDVSTEGFGKGIYIIQVDNGKSRQTQKLVIQ